MRNDYGWKFRVGGMLPNGEEGRGNNFKRQRRKRKKRSRPSDRTLIALWIRTKTVRMKRYHASFEKIAEHNTNVGRGIEQPITPLPEVQFPAGYRISAMACCKAFRAATKIAPRLTLEEVRQLDIDSCEDVLFALMALVHKGVSHAIRNFALVLRLKAQLSGEFPTNRIEHTVPGTDPTQWRIPDEEVHEMFGRLTPEERAEFLRLYDIFAGRAVVEETGPPSAPGESAYQQDLPLPARNVQKK